MTGYFASAPQPALNSRTGPSRRDIEVSVTAPSMPVALTAYCFLSTFIALSR